jgi:hypothetical protein
LYLAIYDYSVLGSVSEFIVQLGIAATQTVEKTISVNVTFLVVRKLIKISLRQSDCQRQLIALTNLVGVSRNKALPLIVETCHCRVSFVAVFTSLANAGTCDLGIAAQYAELSSVLRIAQKVSSFASRSLSSSGLRPPSARA